MATLRLLVEVDTKRDLSGTEKIEVAEAVMMELKEINQCTGFVDDLPYSHDIGFDLTVKPL